MLVDGEEEDEDEDDDEEEEAENIVLAHTLVAS